MTSPIYPLFTLPIESEEDVVLARQRARQTAAALAFDGQDQIRIATAVSEIARNAYSYGGGGRIEFRVEGSRAPQLLTITIRDRGPGIKNLEEILSGRYKSSTGMGLGLIGAKRLVDRVHVDTSSTGTSVSLTKLLPPHSELYSGSQLESLAQQLMLDPRRTAMEELRLQNVDLVAALEELGRRRQELETLNRELEDTNRGVVALYAELDEKAEHLRRADDMKTKFLSNMTHEFRTPLNSILALSKLLLDELDGPLNDEQRKQVGFIRKGADGLSELVNDLLDIAKIEAGKTTIAAKEFSVADLLSALRGMLRPLLLNTSVALVFEESDDLPPMISDEAKVSQILRNFISNALKFTEHGEVRVSVRYDPSIDIVEFTVADTGIGIAPADQETIFREFSQIEHRLQKRARGTGLGLPITAKLVDLLGGRLTLESAVGKGSTFRAAIPRVHSVASAPLPGLTVVADDPRMPILFLDDDADTLALYEKYLAGTSFRVLPARDLKEARYGLQFRPRVIVLDVLLVGEDSWPFLAELKRDASTRNTPVMVLTAVEDQHKAVVLGANAYSLKPVGRETLIRTLTELTTSWRILVIDDDEATRYVLSRALAELNCNVVEAGTGTEGLQKAKDDRPDLVFLDLNLPEMGGVDVLQHLKEDPATAALPVIIYTSRPLDESLTRELKGHAALVLSKQQYDRDALITAVRQLLPIGAA
ncbi:MAG TPA: ATP-binding protein [Thermoanaerobaculia bacterium]|nr:ATP-binding protein [Thermoanaerobaculia bacterium]